MSLSTESLHVSEPAPESLAGAGSIRLTASPPVVSWHPPSFRHLCVLVAGIYLKRSEDGFPIENVGNDAGERWMFDRECRE